MHRLQLIIITGFIALNLSGQSFVKIDSATYAQYLAGDWKTLVREGKAALDQDVDYYYLRMRMGIAYYELENYRAAIDQLNQSLSEEFDELEEEADALLDPGTQN